MNRNFWTRNGI